MSMDTSSSRIRCHPEVPGGYKCGRKLICGRCANYIHNDMRDSPLRPLPRWSEDRFTDIDEFASTNMFPAAGPPLVRGGSTSS